jgi:hypothetical protein
LLWLHIMNLVVFFPFPFHGIVWETLLLVLPKQSVEFSSEATWSLGSSLLWDSLLILQSHELVIDLLMWVKSSSFSFGKLNACGG